MPTKQPSTQPPKRGRKPKEIDQSIFEGLCRILASKAEITGIFQVSNDTLERWIKRVYGREATFGGVFKDKSAPGLISLRRAQFSCAIESKNPALLIWLGKQWLGQRDVAAFKSPDLSQLSEEALKKLAEGADPSTVIETTQESQVLAAPIVTDRVN